MITRRRLLEKAGKGTLLAASAATVPQLFATAAGAEGLPKPSPGLQLSPMLPEGVRAEAILDALPGKKPLIKLSYRPPNYETPIEYFRSDITPNDAFFVRYHLAGIPRVDAEAWRLTIGGEGANQEIAFGLDELRKLPSAEVTALCQCSGNRRGLFQPHVPGVEWGYGAMGCARWKGVRLKDLLDRAGLKKEAIEIVVQGADGPVTDKTPAFIKSLPVGKAIDDATLVAYEMNGQPLPHWNGFPARLVVPGWTGTYWMKHLTTVRAVTKPYDGFWMKSAYRIPVGKFPILARFPSQETAVNTPITDMVVNSLITSHADGASVKAGATVTIAGVAWDGGYGLNSVEVSLDGGKNWTTAALGEDHGPYALRSFSLHFTPRGAGAHVIMARATNKIGQSQATSLIPNPAGYHHNLIQALTLVAA
jgi:DMSO/TMAO reductase YedYZ molybdopterin-dependent catalytic subunit